MNNNLEALMTNWLFENKKEQVSNGTFEKLIRSAKLYIYPNLGTMAVSEITSEDIQHLITDILYKEKNLTFATAHKCRCLLNNFFDYCVTENYVKNNPVTNTLARPQLEDKDKNGKQRLEKNDYLKIIDAVSASRFWKPLCLTVMHTGIRINEILALQWRDIDFENKVIKIRNVIAPIGSGAYGITEYRTPQARRTLPLTNYLCDLLKTHKKFREREQKQIRNKYSYIADNDLVFGNEESGLRSYSGLSHNFRKFLKSQGLEHLNVTLHSLRQFVKEQLKKCNIGKIQFVNSDHSQDYAEIRKKYCEAIPLVKSQGFEL